MPARLFPSPLAAALIGLTMLLAALVPGRAADLTETRIAAFLDTLDALKLETEAGAYPNATALLPGEDTRDVAPYVTADGEFYVFRRIADGIGAWPAEEAQLQTAVSAAGFASIADWAATGDRAGLVYLASSMPRGMAQQLAALDPQTRAMLVSPELADQMDQIMLVAEAADTVTSEEIAAIAPHRERIGDLVQSAAH